MQAKKKIMRSSARKGRKPPSVLSPIIVKVNPEDRVMFMAKAVKWSDGNMSALVRQAVEEFKMPRGKRLTLKPYK